MSDHAFDGPEYMMHESRKQPPHRERSGKRAPPIEFEDLSETEGLAEAMEAMAAWFWSRQQRDSGNPPN